MDSRVLPWVMQIGLPDVAMKEPARRARSAIVMCPLGWPPYASTRQADSCAYQGIAINGQTEDGRTT